MLYFLRCYLISGLRFHQQTSFLPQINLNKVLIFQGVTGKSSKSLAAVTRQ